MTCNGGLDGQIQQGLNLGQCRARSHQALGHKFLFLRTATFTHIAIPEPLTISKKKKIFFLRQLAFIIKSHPHTRHDDT